MTHNKTFFVEVY